MSRSPTAAVKSSAAAKRMQLFTKTRLSSKSCIGSNPVKVRSRLGATPPGVGAQLASILNDEPLPGHTESAVWL